MTNAETKSFLVDVCEDHSVSDSAEMRMRSLTSIIASIVAGISIFALIYAGADYWVGRPVSPWVYSYLLILGFSLFFVYIAFRPSALEASFRIIGFDFDLQYVWFAMSNPMYRSLFVKENPFDAELVSWIVKV
jgi:TRAP-type C4-dicarboxylate transport system permease small subunit